MHKEAYQLREGVKKTRFLWSRHYLHTVLLQKLTLSIFLVLFFQFQHSVSKAADKQRMLHNTAEFDFQKSSEYLKLTLVLLQALSLLAPQGPSGLSGGVGQPGLVGEKVRHPLAATKPCDSAHVV